MINWITSVLSIIGVSGMIGAWSHGMHDRIRDGLRLERWEVLQKERHHETTFTKGEQILLVQRDYVPFGILIDDTVGDDDRSAFVRVAGVVE